MRWYCAYTKPDAELWARTSLWERDFEVYLPRYRRRRRHARRTTWVEAPLFPRYLFVRADFEDRSARGIAFAPGVVHLVRFGEAPAVVADAVIAEIKSREDDSGLVDLDGGRGAASRYQSGDRVRIEEGALCDQVGLFQAKVDAERVIILLNLLGRDVRAVVRAQALRREGP